MQSPSPEYGKFHRMPCFLHINSMRKKKGGGGGDYYRLKKT